MTDWLQNYCSAFFLIPSFFSLLWHYHNNPRLGPRLVGLLRFERMLIKIRHLKAPMLCLIEGGKLVRWSSDSVLFACRRHSWCRLWSILGCINSNLVDSWIKMLQSLSCALRPFISVVIDTIKTRLQASWIMGQRELNLSTRKFIDSKAKRYHSEWLVWPLINWVIHVYVDLIFFSW